MDLWKEKKTAAHVERLADVVEIIMAAAHGEEFFRDLFERPLYLQKLPQIYQKLRELCKLVQALDSRLSSGYLKHTRQPVPKFAGEDPQRGLAALEFTRRWTGGELDDKGLLFFGLLHASREDLRL